MDSAPKIKKPDDVPLLVPTGEKTKFPVSFAQEFFLKSSAGHKHRHDISIINSLDGTLNVTALKNSIEKIINRHWVLKSKFLVDGFKSCEIVNSFEHPFFFEKDFQNVPEDQLEEAVLNEVGEILGNKPNDLTSPPLISCYLLKIGEQEHWIVIKLHHVAFDGQSLPVFQNELKEFYTAEVENRSPQLPELPVQYGDFAIWERKFATHKRMDSKKAYWKNIFTNFPRVDIRRKTEGPDEARTIRGTIDAELMKGLTAFGKKNSASLYQIACLALGLVLHRISNKEEVALVSWSSIRHSKAKDLLGIFQTNTCLRISFKDKPPTEKLLKQIQMNLMECLSNLVPAQIYFDLPAEKDLEALGITPIAIHMVEQRVPLNLPGIEAEVLTTEGDSSSMGLPIFFQIINSKEEAPYFMVYSKQFYEDEMVDKIAHQFNEVLVELSKLA